MNVERLPGGRTLRSIVDFYGTMMRTSVVSQLQYRVAQYFYMLGMVAEPVIYLVVWSTIARQHGGAVNGITAGQFAAYYIVWTLVRNMNIVFGAPFWEFRIREGRLSGDLLRPLNILHYDLAFFAGWKFVVVALWIPIAIGLSLVFHPDLHPTRTEIVAFVAAIWGAYLDPQHVPGRRSGCSTSGRPGEPPSSISTWRPRCSCRAGSCR